MSDRKIARPIGRRIAKLTDNKIGKRIGSKTTRLIDSRIGDQIPVANCVDLSVQIKPQVTMVSREGTTPVTSKWIAMQIGRWIGKRITGLIVADTTGNLNGLNETRGSRLKS